ncbi:unnamed protein product [Brassicogethes aeneus]|uniref:Reverse transcriptase n=1 Tax=Brassicogethes aeneus TaxID=1431903 RepID=A0A9P0FEC5_BRAAE|nr:unnamed protein product [Brassicogethes aeneus]
MAFNIILFLQNLNNPMDENEVYLFDDFVTKDSIYIIDTKFVEKENDCRADCESLDTHASLDSVKLSNSSEGSKNSGQSQVNKEIKEEIANHCLDDLHVESEALNIFGNWPSDPVVSECRIKCFKRRVINEQAISLIRKYNQLLNKDEDQIQSKINDSAEESDNSDDGEESKDFYCNIKEEGRDGDFSEEYDKNSARNEDKDEDEAMFETKIEVEYHGVQCSDMSGKEELFKCDFCLKKFQRKGSLLNHKKNFHLKDECNKCDYVTVKKYYFNRHLKMHDKKNKLKCHFCPYMAAKLRTLNSHILSKHKLENVGENKIKISSKIHECSKCLYASVSKTNYTNHIKVCWKLKNIEWYKCQICPFRAIQKNKLTRHIKTHTKIKDLKCSFCHYQCNGKQNLDNHILRKHSDLLNENNKNIITSKIHSCKHCYFKSAMTDSFKKHLKNLNNTMDENEIYLFEDFVTEDSIYVIDTKVVEKENDCRADNIFNNFLQFTDLKQYNTVLNFNGGMLDLCISDKNCAVSRETVQMVSEDKYHPSISIILNVSSRNYSNFPSSNRKKSYNFKKANFPELYEAILREDWNFLNAYIDPNMACDAFYSKLYSLFDLYVPPRKASNNNYPLWFNKDIIKNIKLKSNYHKKHREQNSEYYLNLFKRTRRILKTQIASAYRKYINNIEENLTNDPKKFWSFVNEKRGQTRIPANVFCGNMKYETPQDVVNGFAHYFNSVYTNTTPDLSNLQNCNHVLVYPLLILFNLILSTSTFPDVWKLTRVCPILKSGDPCDLTNYRPIALLSNFAKVFESSVYTIIYNNIKNIISSQQHGFMSKRSTLTNLAEFSQFTSTYLDSKCQVDVVYTDFSKAFDKVNHGILLKKLGNFGFSHSLIQLIKSYLYNRKLFVCYNGFNSNYFVATSGVPQGSNLGPLLFNIFINDLSLALSCQHLLFADDLKLFHKISSTQDSFYLQEQLDTVANWFNLNELSLNINKCKICTFTLKALPIVFDYFINNSILSRTDTIKDLGVVFDSKLSFNAHIQSISSSTLKLLGFINRNTSTFKNITALNALYCQLIRSRLEYCSIIWYPCYQSQINILENIQRRYLKLISYPVKPQIHVSIDSVKLSNSSGSRNSGQSQSNKKIKEEIEHCLDDLPVESESKINDSAEESDNSDVGDESEDFYCNIKEEGTTEIEVEYHGVQCSNIGGKEKFFKCDFSLKKNQTKWTLLKHIKNFHLKDKTEQFKCNKCDYVTVPFWHSLILTSTSPKLPIPCLKPPKQVKKAISCLETPWVLRGNTVGFACFHCGCGITVVTRLYKWNKPCFNRDSKTARSRKANQRQDYAREYWSRDSLSRAGLSARGLRSRGLLGRVFVAGAYQREDYSHESYLRTVFTIWLYHPPQKENVKFINYFNNYLDQVSTHEGINIIVGDFNYDLTKYSFYGDKILRNIFSNGFTQIVDTPTRITNVSSTLIDYIITNNKNLSFKVHLSPKISDHCLISVQLEQKTHESITTVNRRSMRNYNTNNLQDYLLDIEWNNSSSDVNILANNFINDISRVFNEKCPKRTISFCNKYENKKWITPQIKQQMQERDSLYVRAVQEKNNVIWSEYKRLRNCIVSSIKCEKDKFFKQTIYDNKNNSCKMWKNLKLLLPEKISSSPAEINFEGTVIKNELDIANKFNNYFVNSIVDIVSVIPKHHAVASNVELSPVFHVFEKFQSVSMTEMKKIIKTMKNVGGCESGVSKKVLCDICDVAGNRLLDVLNTSLYTGVFPEEWKRSIIVPVPKVQKTILHNQFRPINTVEVYEKVLELVVKKQLQYHCDVNNILVSNQSGFRSNHSCESVVVNICDTFVKLIDKGKIVLAVFLDLRRAFETVDRDILINKLNKYGLNATVLKWFKSYLTNRQQKVKYKNATSNPVFVNYGVPQGTVLGPLLFLLYVNDIVKVVKHCQIELFADDTMVYVSGTDVKHMEKILNHDLDCIFKWLCNNNLSINTDKTKFCLFGRKSKLNLNALNNVSIVINNINIMPVNQIKYLGVIFDNELNFHAHADYILRKFSKKVNFISRIVKNKMLPDYICKKTQYFKEVHSYNTRNCNDFILTDKCNTSQMLNSIMYKGLLEFNKLPNDIKNLNNTMVENEVYLFDDFVTEDSIYIIDTKFVEKENDCRADCETSDTHVSINSDKLSEFSEGSRNTGQSQVNKEIKEEIEKHCLDDLYVESEFKINDSAEKIDNSDVGDESKHFYCNIKEEGRDGDFSEEDDQNSAHNEEKNEDEAMFETKIELEYHGVQCSDMSGKEKLFKCDFCLKKFQRKGNLLNHKKNFHLKDKQEQFKCNKCDYVTVKKRYFNRHLIIHDKKKYFKCHFCPHMAAELKTLNSHILSKHKIENVGENKIKITSKIHECTKCPYSTLNKTTYENHIKVCLKLKNVEWYKCQICHFKTIRKGTLTRHIKTHTKIKDLKCSFCHYQCNRKDNLDNHILRNH